MSSKLMVGFGGSPRFASHYPCVFPPNNQLRCHSMRDSVEVAKIVVLTVNDVHDVLPGDRRGEGIAGLATLLERERARIPDGATLLVTLNGDFLSGSQLAGRCKGAHMIELMNHLGIQYVVLGNHEFDFGCHTLRERMKASKFKYFGSNVLENPSHKILDGVIDTEIIQLTDGLKLGMFGVCTEDTPLTSYPGEDVMFDDVFKTSKRCVESLQAQGADFIIALTHLTIEEDKLLARRVKGIDVILGGHDHEPFTLYEGSTFIHKSGQNAMWLAKLEFELSKCMVYPQRSLSVSTQWSMLTTQKVPPNITCQKIVQKYCQLLEMEGNHTDNGRVLATLAKPLSTRTAALRAGESNMGNLVADALCCELNADYGLINGGFIRGDKVYDATTNFTVGMVNQEMPFPNPTAVVRIQVRDFGDAILEHMAKYPHMSGSHPHISGLRLVVDCRTQPARIVAMSNDMGHDIDLDEWVLVATTKFIAQGGDGCRSWLRGEIVRIGETVSNYAASFMEKKRVISFPECEGRIRILE